MKIQKEQYFPNILNRFLKQLKIVFLKIKDQKIIKKRRKIIK